jgi:leader peptidase (prepilin peptidase) / N-methyltransferase
VLVLAGALVGLLLGPWLAVTTVRLADRDRAARPTRRRVLVTAAVSAGALAAAPALTGPRPATVALAWFGGAAVVLAAVDLACHRLPDRVTFPAAAVCAVALLADAVVTGEWTAAGRAAAASAAVLVLATGARLLSPGGLGRGDVKLLGLLGLLLGWAGWGVLMAGVFLGLLAGAAVSLLLVATRRADWRTPVPFGPPLLVGAVLALLVEGPLG